MYWFAELLGGMIFGALIEFIERVWAGLWRLGVRVWHWLAGVGRSRA